eukprot:NODE_2058_length_1214_cov_15.786266_g1709_i0.p1 GENE.NODE_2058_length_1214_cov_15.786266_g1709_i0~~NODE_2058_length_1214_cov_15.786266_g1709_i0.p1  ORF type:complete len:251 (+),score=37.96 NODE_2058_length_1214_cov_15.786266_g1709_i0:432-1184(+)
MLCKSQVNPCQKLRIMFFSSFDADSSSDDDSDSSSDESSSSDEAPAESTSRKSQRSSSGGKECSTSLRPPTKKARCPDRIPLTLPLPHGCAWRVLNSDILTGFKEQQVSFHNSSEPVSWDLSAIKVADVPSVGGKGIFATKTISKKGTVLMVYGGPTKLDGQAWGEFDLAVRNSQTARIDGSFMSTSPHVWKCFGPGNKDEQKCAAFAGGLVNCYRGLSVKKNVRFVDMDLKKDKKTLPFVALQTVEEVL